MGAKPSEVALVACQLRANTLHLSLAGVWELQTKMQPGKFGTRLARPVIATSSNKMDFY